MTRADDAPRGERFERGTGAACAADCDVEDAEAPDSVIVRGAAGHPPSMGRWSSRALVLTSGVLLLDGCGVRTELLEPWQPASATPADGDLEASPPADSDESAEVDVVERPQLGSCAFEDQSILCVPGDVCRANFVVGPSPFICGPSADPSTPCGLIACGAGCACADATNSACRCE